MNMYDFGGAASEVYTEICVCGNEVKVSTQTDSYPEYYTEVFIKCECGNSVGFTLPVN